MTMTTRIKLLLALHFPFFVFAQPTSYGNFKVAEQEIIYQKVIANDSITVAALEAYYKTLPYLSNLSIKSDGLEFIMNDITVDYKKFQFSQVNTHIVLQTGKFSGKVLVGVRDGRYRVTVTAIEFTGNLGYKIVQEKEYLTPYATKNSGTLLAPDWCRPNLLGLLDKAFTDKLEKKAVEEEW
jgi:hypothetical protein